MAQKKAHEVDAWLARPDSDTFFVLIYGPDRGLVSERAKAFAQNTGLPLDDPFSVVRIDAAETDEPERLLTEARTVPMFADRRLVWVRGAANQPAVVGAVKSLLAEPPSDCILLVEAGDLKKGSALRSAVEGGAGAMALPCYSDDGRSIDAVIDDVLSNEKLTIGLEARQILKANLGGDRLASRSELEKLALYCAGSGEVTAEDVRAAIGDASGMNMDAAIDAVFCGRVSEFDTLFSRHVAGGNPAFLVLSAALRNVQAMQIMREQVEGGKTPSAAVASARPPVFFARRRAVEQALQRWTRAKLQAAGERLQGAILKSRQHPAMAVSLSRQALLALAIEGARAAR